MENREEILQILERFTRLNQKKIPKELENYFQYVAKTGDTMFKWSSLKYLFREKLLSVIEHFKEESQLIVDPVLGSRLILTVDPFNYETMKSSLLKRLDSFNAAPFTVQRLCELLIDPCKQYSRIDTFMRALEKILLVVTTIDPVANEDLSLNVNIDIEMEIDNVFNIVIERNKRSADQETNLPTLEVNCPRSDDASSVQPKPKKAKLDDDSIENKPEADQANADIADPNNDGGAVNAAKEATEFQKSDESNTVAAAPETADKESEVEPDPEAANDIPAAALESYDTENAALEAAKHLVAKKDESKIVEKQSAEKETKPSVDKVAEKKTNKAAPVAVEDTQETAAEILKPEVVNKTEKFAGKSTIDEPKAEAEEKDAKDNDNEMELSIAEADDRTETELEINSKADINETNTEKTEIKVDAEPKAKEADPDAAAGVTPPEEDNIKTLVAEAAVPTEESKAAESEAKSVGDAVAPASVASSAAEATGASVDVPIERDELQPTTENIGPAPVDAGAILTLALNEQPMEDTSAEEGNGQENPSSAAVNEVVMAENRTGAAGGSGDIDKDELIAMEVE